MKTTRAGRFLAVTILAGLLTASFAIAQKDDQAEVLMQAAHQKQLVEGQLEEAIQLYKRIVQEHAGNRVLAAKALVQMGQCYEKLGKEEARKAYERVLRDYADQHEVVAEARARLAKLVQSAAPKVSEPVVRQVWAGPTVDFLGVPSADGHYLLMTDWETGDLGIRDLVAGETRRLTNKGTWAQSSEFALFPILSPDGKQIAYGWFNKEWTWDLRVIGTDGSAPRVLYQSPEVDFVSPGGWTPDGKYIAVAIVRKGRTTQAALISVADGSLRVLKTKPSGGGGSKIALSPDGRYIAYDGWPDPETKENDIFLLSVETGQEIPLVQHPANDLCPVWTPDGKRVLFASDRSGTLGLWVQQVVEGKPKGAPELVKPDVGHIWPMGFTQKGSFYYGLETGMNDVYTATLDLKAVRVLDAPTPLSQRYVGSNSSPAWSPDGKYIAYVSQRGPGRAGANTRNKVVAIRSVETGQERDILVDLTIVTRPLWSPDSLSIVVSGQRRERPSNGIFRIDVQSGELTTLVQEEGNNYRWPALSQDAKTLFYLQINFPKKTWSIRARDLRSGEEKELYSVLPPPVNIGSLGLSPDGQQLAFFLADQAKAVLKVMPATGGEAREICQIQRPAYFPGNTRLVWSPDGERILFVRGGQDPTKPQDQTYELWQVSAAGGEPQKLGLTMERLRDLSLHPDGKRLAFSAGQTKLEVWVMENFLPTLKAAK